MKLKKRNIFKHILLIYIVLPMYILYRINFNYRSNFLLFLIMLLLFIAILLKEKKVPNKVKYLLIYLFIIKSIIAYIIMNSIMLPFPDSYLYLENLSKIKRMNDMSYKSITSVVGSLHVGYEYFMLFIDKIFKNIYAHYLLNIFVANLALIFLYKLIEKKFGSKIASITTIITGISTTFNLFTVNILKDSMVLLLTILSLYLGYLFFSSEKNKVLNFILFTIVTVLLIMTRIYTGFSILIVFIIELIYSLIRLNKKERNNFLKLLVLFSGIVVFKVIEPYFQMMLSGVQNKFKFANLINGFKGVLRVFFSPLPWNMFNERSVYLITIIDSTLLLLFSFSFIMYIIKVFNSKKLFQETYLYLIIIIIHGFVLGLSYDTSAIRQRISVFPLIILLYVLGLHYKDDISLRA